MGGLSSIQIFLGFLDFFNFAKPLRPLLFIAVLDLISKKTVMKDAMKKLLYADDLALVANGKQELQELLEEWNGLFTRNGLKMYL